MGVRVPPSALTFLRGTLSLGLPYSLSRGAPKPHSVREAHSLTLVRSATGARETCAADTDSRSQAALKARNCLNSSSRGNEVRPPNALIDFASAPPS